MSHVRVAAGASLKLGVPLPTVVTAMAPGPQDFKAYVAESGTPLRAALDLYGPAVPVAAKTLRTPGQALQRKVVSPAVSGENVLSKASEPGVPVAAAPSIAAGRGLQVVSAPGVHADPVVVAAVQGETSAAPSPVGIATHVLEQAINEVVALAVPATVHVTAEAAVPNVSKPEVVAVPVATGKVLAPVSLGGGAAAEADLPRLAEPATHLANEPEAVKPVAGERVNNHAASAPQEKKTAKATHAQNTVAGLPALVGPLPAPATQASPVEGAPLAQASAAPVLAQAMAGEVVLPTPGAAVVTVQASPSRVEAVRVAGKTAAVPKAQGLAERKTSSTPEEPVASAPGTSVTNVAPEKTVSKADVPGLAVARDASSTVAVMHVVAAAVPGPPAGVSAAVHTTPLAAESSSLPRPEQVAMTQPGDARTISASPQALEVGVAMGTHGWLRVRAEMSSTGTVDASVVATSQIAAEALHHSLPALREYLAQEQVSVASVQVSSSFAEAARGEGGNGSGSHSQADGGGQRDRHPVGAQAAGDPEPWVGDDAGELTGLLARPGSNGAGGWVSVRV